MTHGPVGSLNTVTGIAGLAAMLWVYGVAWHQPMGESIAWARTEIAAALPSPSELIGDRFRRGSAVADPDATGDGTPSPSDAASATARPPLESGGTAAAQAPIDPELAVLFAARNQRVAVLRAEGPRLLEARSYRRAADICREWVDLELGTASAWRCLGRALQALGSHRDAVTAFRKAKQYDPGDGTLDAAIARSQRAIVSDESNMTRGEAKCLEWYLASARSQGVTVITIPTFVRRISPWNDLRAFLAILRHLCRLRPDLIHTHTSKAGLLGRLAAWLARVPVVVHTPHGHVFYGHFSPALSRFFLLVERMLRRITTHLVALTPGEAEDYMDLGVIPPHKIWVIPSGIDLRRFAGDGVDRLSKRILEEGFLKNPPVVASIPGSDKSVILDGANRVLAFNQAAYRISSPRSSIRGTQG